MSENHEVRWKRLFFGMLAVLLLAILASSSAQAGFVRQDGKRYYYRTSGRKVKGWLKKGKRTYYLDPDQDGAVTVGYLKLAHLRRTRLAIPIVRQRAVYCTGGFGKSGSGITILTEAVTRCRLAG